MSDPPLSDIDLKIKWLGSALPLRIPEFSFLLSRFELSSDPTEIIL